ncbi:5000_t:CDS:2, partial [Acaulospora morrowiae]
MVEVEELHQFTYCSVSKIYGEFVPLCAIKLFLEKGGRVELLATHHQISDDYFTESGSVSWTLNDNDGITSANLVWDMEKLRSTRRLFDVFNQNSLPSIECAFYLSCQRTRVMPNSRSNVLPT